MFPTMTAMNQHLEQEQRERTQRFPSMNEHIRAELEARMADEAETLPQTNRSFSIRRLPGLLRLQHNLK